MNFDVNASKIYQKINNVKRSYLLALGQDLQAIVRDRVDRGVEPSGKPFKKLSQKTIALKKLAGKEKILRWTGQMMNSLNSRVNEQHGLLAVGLSDAKGEKHQLGIDVPARPILDLKGESETEAKIIASQSETMIHECAQILVNGGQ